MIVLWGLSTEGPVRRVREELEHMGQEVEILDQWDAADMVVGLRVAGGVTGSIRAGDRVIELDEITALYARPYDWTQLCIARGLEPGEAEWSRVRQAEEALYAWWDVARGTIVNPPAAMASNGSKPYQMTLIREAGLAIPATLVTTDPAAAQAFWERHGVVVYKSVSGVRSHVARLTPERGARLAEATACPTQFQEYIPGDDVRVHVIGEEVFATRIVTNATDYRYAWREVGEEPKLHPCSLPEAVLESCVAVTAALGLRMSGVDLRRTPDGQWFCFEVNPSPGFTFYESETGQPLAAATARLLTGAQESRLKPPATIAARRGVNSDLGLPDRPFIRREERPDVGQAAIDELLARSSLT